VTGENQKGEKTREVAIPRRIAVSAAIREEARNYRNANVAGP
jgi:hypothetical protein